MKLSDFSATQLTTLLKDKKTTPQEIVTSSLERIKTVDCKVDAWQYINEVAIESQLRKIDSYGSNNYPLFGIPIGVKDIYNTFDMPTQMGSDLWKNFTPGNDARIIHYLRRNAGVILGKTVTAEFSVHYQDRTKNPHDLKRSPGTSSSGSAVAVATGTVPIALGSQTAGSISRPASYCGIYGFKPTFGVLPRIGVLKTTDSLDSLGFLTRSVDDLSLIFDASRVHGKNYEYVHKYIDNYIPIQNKVYNIAIIKHPKWDLASLYAKNSFEKWVSKLKSPYLNIEEINLPLFCDTIHDTHKSIYDKSLSYYFKEEYQRQELISPIFNSIIQNGANISRETYQKALEKQFHDTVAFDEWAKPYDILITLGAADEAPIGLTTPDTQDSNLIWTYLGLPVVTIPVLKGANSLPIGVNVIARKYNDKVLLDFLSYLKSINILADVKPVTPE